MCLICDSLPSEEQLRCNTSRAVWDLGKRAWRRVLHLTQLPWKIPTWEGMHLHYRRSDFLSFCRLFPPLSCVDSPLILPAPCCSLSSTVHRPVLRWEVLHRAVLGVQVWPHRSPWRPLHILTHHWPLLRAGKPCVCPLQWEVPVHQVCGWQWTGSHRLLCSV